MLVPPRAARFTVPIVAALGGLLLASAQAHAGVATVNGPAIEFTAAPGEVNDVRADPRPDGVLLTDASAPLTAGPGCVAQLDGVFCPYPAVAGGPAVELRLLDGDDRGVVDDLTGLVAAMRVLGGTGADFARVGGSAPTLAVADGGPGADELTSSTNFTGDVTLTGGGGNDLLRAREIASRTLLQGGDGHDRLDIGELLVAGARFEGNDGNDTFLAPHGGVLPIAGGAGFDTLSFAGLTAAPAVFDLETCPECSTEKIVGSALGDVLSGDAGSTLFLGGAGDDEIDPRGGIDVVAAGDGLDRVQVAGDRRTDVVSCGGDADEVTADRRDIVARDCEAVTR